MATPLLDLSLHRFSRGGSTILRDVNLQMQRGETLALTGPSGIGKTSILRVIAGLEAAYEGNCQINGTLAMVFQEPTLLPWRSALHNITLTTGVSAQAAQTALAEVGLADRAGTFPEQLSLGQQRRLALARAFAKRPDLLLLDEPFVSLDPALSAEMQDLFKRLRDTHGTGTLLVTHVQTEAAHLANRILTLTGSPATLALAPDLGAGRVIPQ